VVDFLPWSFHLVRKDVQKTHEMGGYAVELEAKNEFIHYKSLFNMAY
jgi:hypothetical protein